jgi:hypothetical protein
MGIDGRFDGGFDGGLFDWFHLAMLLGYWPQQIIWQLRQEALMAISQEGFITGYYNSDEPSCRGSSPFVMVENVSKE